MAISITRYVDITSGVGAGAAVSTRELIGRFFTTNELVPTGSQIEFESADEVGDYFGTSSNEYDRAVFYFGWVSKNITAPQKISFARWADDATAPQIFGVKGAQALASWTAITSGAFTLTIGGVSNTMSSMNFSAAGSLSAVAAIVQAAIRAAGTGAQWDNATVVWNSTRQSFDFEGGATGAAVITVTAGSGGSDIAAQLGWLSATTVISDGAAAQTITEVLSDSANADNNFGSFTFIPTLSNDEIVEAAEWNLAQNNLFMYSVRCTSSDATTLSGLLADIGGVCLTLSPDAGEYPEQVPMMILAATDYAARNSVQNYMFQQFNLSPSVTTNTDATTYDDLRVNYYGQTQSAGQLIEFYQRGVMQGLPVDPRDQNTYANEIWLKDAATAAIMTILLAMPRIPANAKGRAQLLAILQGVINQALFNGTISVGKPLTTAQKEYINEITGSATAWQQVQNVGYWVDAQIVTYVESGVTRYKAVYTLIYAKDDVIRKVEGRDILI